MAAQPPRDGRRTTGRTTGKKLADGENVVPFRPREQRKPKEQGRSREKQPVRPREPNQARPRRPDAEQYHPRGRTVRESAEPARPRGARASRPPAASRVRHADGGGGVQRGAAPRAGAQSRSTAGRAAQNTAAQNRAAPKRTAQNRATRSRGAQSPPPRRRPVPIPPPRPPRRKRGIARLGNPNARLRICLAVLLALFVVIGGRLVQIQTSEGYRYATMAAEGRRVTEELYAPRGAILDRDGNVLAHDVQGATIAADPGYVENDAERAEVAEAVAPLLGMSTAAVEEKLARTTHADGSPNRYVVLKKKVPLAVGDAVNRLRESIPSLIVQEDKLREVPGGDLAANVVGYTGTEGTGLAGLEAGYDDVLKGVDGKRVYDKGITGGQEIPDGYHKTIPARAGSDLVLTLDRDLQYQADKLLTERLAATKAWTGSAIVMDAKTGEILAMVSADTTPAAKKKGTVPELATAAVVEPGSVHKALTIAAGLDAGVIRPDSVLTLPETIEKGGTTYRDTHDHGSPRYTLMGVLAQSSNVGTIMVADKLGADRLYAYQRAFGLGTKTGIGLPGESRGIVQPPSNWSGPSAGSIPIGLGVAATPLQMTALYATLANGGMKVQPQLVKNIVGSDGTVRKPQGPRPERVVSEEAAKTVVRDMTAIATPEGTAPLAAVPGYQVAGKTGTGKRAEGNKYMAGNVTSFIGIVPADSPRYVISVFIHTPEGVGGAIAGPMFSDLAGFTLRRYGVSPSGAAPPPITLYG